MAAAAAAAKQAARLRRALATISAITAKSKWKYVQIVSFASDETRILSSVIVA
jgi:hypothetical protein